MMMRTAGTLVLALLLVPPPIAAEEPAKTSLSPPFCGLKIP